jgi:hypothetical protein
MTLMNAQHDMTSLRHLPKRKKKGKKEKMPSVFVFSRLPLLHLSVIQVSHIYQ